MRKIEKEEERIAYDQPDKKVYHLCIVNLVIGYVTSLYFHVVICCEKQVLLLVCPCVCLSLCVFVCLSVQKLEIYC